MPEVLRAEIGGEARLLGAPEPTLDPATAAVVERETASAYARGLAEGQRAGREAAVEQTTRAVGAITASIAALHEEVASQRGTATAAALDLARELAGEVLGRTAPDEALVVLERVREAADALDDVPLEVRLHPDDHAALQGAPVEPRLRLVADTSVAPGEARLVGAWGGAELTRARLLEAVAAAREEQGR